MMKTYLFIALAGLLFLSSAQVMSAQESLLSDGYEIVDSVIYRPASAVDSTLVGVDVFDNMPSRSRGGKADVSIRQSPSLEQSMRSHIGSNRSRALSGYRVRIFFDNKQSARTESESALKYFQSIYKGVPAYRTYANPYFKVTVGDFRTKSEAMELLARIRKEFPSAFVVKENISYPVVDKKNAYIADTIKVVRPKSVSNQ